MPKKEAKKNTFIYKGLSAQGKKSRLAQYEASIAPPSPRGVDDPYRPDTFDSEDEKEAKRKRAANWHKAAVAEYKKGLEDLDAGMTFKDARSPGGKIVFEKGKPVSLPESHLLTKSLLAKTKDHGRYPPQWELVEEVVKAPAKTTTKLEK